MNYEIRHDEYRGNGNENEYRHGIFFLPLNKRDDIIQHLITIREEYKVSLKKDIKFAGCLKNYKNKNSQVIKNNLSLFSHLLLTQNIISTPIFHITPKDIYKQKFEPYLEIRGMFGCKFVLFHIPDNHKELNKYNMSYADLVETTFRMGFKGGAHSFFSKANPINITDFFFDGHQHHNGNINIDRITKGNFREYCTFSDKCKIDDSHIENRDEYSKLIMSFVDNIVGAWAAKFKKIPDKDKILYSLNGLYNSLKSREIIKNYKNNWHRSISVSKLLVDDGNIKFPDFFEEQDQPRLF